MDGKPKGTWAGGGGILGHISKHIGQLYAQSSAQSYHPLYFGLLQCGSTLMEHKYKGQN